MAEYTVTLPDGHVLHCVATEHRKPVNTLRPGTLFLDNGQVWEALPGSNANLSDLNDGSEIISFEKVTVLREVPGPCSCRRCLRKGEEGPRLVTPSPAVVAARKKDLSKFKVQAGE